MVRSSSVVKLTGVPVTGATVAWAGATGVGSVASVGLATGEVVGETGCVFSPPPQAASRRVRKTTRARRADLTSLPRSPIAPARR